MSTLFAPTMLDFYKVGHINQYPKGTTRIYSNGTARSGKHSNIPDGDSVVYVGMQRVIIKTLIEAWNDTFFSQPKEEVIQKFSRRVNNGLGYDVDVSHMEALHDLGYLPIEIRSLPEGSIVPYKVPLFTIENTLDDFYWVTNALETVISTELYPMINSATTYNEYRKTFIEYAKDTGGDLSFVPFQGHDFSLRGMFGVEAGAMSGLAALLAGSMGTDTVPAIDEAEYYYGADSDKELVGMSVNATEHSVMCAGGAGDEIETFRRLMNKIYPTGILSIVSDTWDFWNVVTVMLPILKDEIMEREGKIVIRPDSGDPVKILTGYKVAPYGSNIFNGSRTTEYEAVVNEDGDYLTVDVTGNLITKITEAEAKGLIECLWDTFGGITVKGSDGNVYKLLDEHIGAIYGDSITLDRQEQILSRLKDKCFSSSNIVLGIGSYTYQYVTRDTHGFAIKATYAEVDGVGRELFKDPKTDDGIKKSAKGLLMVKSYNDGAMFKLEDQVTRTQQKRGALELIFRDGELLKEVTLDEVRKRVARFD